MEVALTSGKIFFYLSSGAFFGAFAVAMLWSIVRLATLVGGDRQLTVGVQRRARLSDKIARAAFAPGAPVTPPPGWAPEPHI